MDTKNVSCKIFHAFCKYNAPVCGSTNQGEMFFVLYFLCALCGKKNIPSLLIPSPK